MTPIEATAVLVVRIGGGEYALDVASVRRIEFHQPPRRIPGTPPFLAGVVQIRGELFPLLDPRPRLGAAAPAPDLNARIILVETGDQPIGLLVDAVVGVRSPERPAEGAFRRLVPEQLLRFEERGQLFGVEDTMRRGVTDTGLPAGGTT